MIELGPRHGEQERIGVSRGLRGSAGASVVSRVACQPLQFLVAVLVAQLHVVAGAGEDGSELTAHETGAEYTDAHGVPLSD